MSCGDISSNISANCADPLIAGVNARLFLINKGDIATVTYDVSNAMLITGMTLAAGKYAYVYTGIKRSNSTKSTMVKKKFINFWKHMVNMIIFSNDPASKEEINQLPHGSYVAIVENNYTGSNGNAAFEVFGIKNGLEGEAIERDSENADTGGAWTVTLASNDEGLEDKSSRTFYTGTPTPSYSLTKAAIEALLAP